MPTLGNNQQHLQYNRTLFQGQGVIIPKKSRDGQIIAQIVHYQARNPNGSADAIKKEE